MNEQYCLHCMEKIDANPGNGYCQYCHNAFSYDAPVHHIKPGTVLKDKYLIGKALGEGGFGITYIGRDLTLDMRIAVKEFYPNGYSHRNHNYDNHITLTQSNDAQSFEKNMQRFLNEARTLAKFSGEPGIVGVRDFFRENGTAYIVMEYLDGITLKAYLQEHGTIPAAELFRMIDPVLVSLDRIHEQGLIHRDISPDNIMVMKNGNLKLLDFGAAREVNADKSLSVVLKHGYAPEEQYRTKGKQGPWTDVYAMCATLYKCLTGITPMESLERVYNDELKRPSQLGITISKSQEAALMNGLNVRIGDRLQNMMELRSGLQVQDDSGSIQSVTVYKAVEEDETKTLYEPATGTLTDQGQTFDVHNTPEELPSQEDPILPVSETSSPDTSDVNSDKHDDPKNNKDTAKRRKPITIAAAAIVVIAFIVVIALVTPSKPPQTSIQNSIPTERMMTSDCGTVLQWSDIDCSVLDLNIQDENLSEKYKTLIVTCDVTVLENSAEKHHVIELYYEYDNENWVLSNLSKITE